ncbi:MAG TPA: DUF4129 domain-containing protein [Ktedonobacterales bacterium]|nr:DUF4129 domain-containing protein [Ktedonobacterales bacterium]
MQRHNTPAAGAKRGPWWSSSSGQTALRAVSGCLVELLPIEAWLLVLAGTVGDPPNQAAVPFWYLCVLMGAACGFSYRARGKRGSHFLIADFVPFVALYLLALLVSPAAFGSESAGFLDFSWISARGGAVFDRPDITANLIALFLLLAFLWWRGTVIASSVPATSTALRRFGISFSLLLLAVVGLNAVPSNVRDPYSAALTLLLIGEVFCGLFSASLAHLDAQRHDAGMAGDRNDAQWIGSAVVVELLVVILALFASLVFNFQSFLALLGYLGPVGQAIGTVLTWLVSLLVIVLNWLLTPLFSSFRYRWPRRAPLFSPPAKFQCVTVQVNGKSVVRCGNGQTPSSLAWLVHLGVAVVVIGVLALIGLALYLAVRKYLIKPSRSDDEGAADEREALDGRSLFAAQLRSLLDRFGTRTTPERDPLQRGTVRYIYRDVLRAAMSQGLDRTPAETPDEYAQRLTKTAPLATHETGETDDLMALSDAYNDARYADREPGVLARQSLQERAHRLTRLLGG